MRRLTQHIILKIVGFQLYVPALPLSTTMLILVLYMAYTCISNLNEFKSFMNKTCTAFIVPSSSSCNQDIFLETSLIFFCDENEHSTVINANVFLGMPNPKKVIWQKKEEIQKSPTTPAIMHQIILTKTTSVFNGGVHSKAVKIPKSLD